MAENEKSDPSSTQRGETLASLPTRETQDTLLQALREALRASLPEDPAPDSAQEEPISAEEFAAALESLHKTGWTFDEAARLRRIDDGPANAGNQRDLIALQERYPYLPGEVRELLWFLLTGNDPDPEIVGPSDEIAMKCEVLQRLVLTDALRERFYLRECGKVPRFRELDWEVVIKAVERGHQNAPGYPYALMTLDAVNDVHGHHEHETLSFAIGLHGLRRLVAELSELLARLEEIHQSVNQGSQEPPGARNARRAP